MKKLIPILLGLALAGFVTSAQAAKGEKKNKRGGEDTFAKYDANSNGKLDTDEIETLKKDFASGKEALKKLDLNGDGKLDDGEVAAVKPEAKKKKKKNA
ncbi:MAG: hypothetical protein HZA89_12045 [Verrucomicrobia bacterium]|nr:hypothetical protein [Verrucomicrobiota bacterium]